MTIEGFFVSNFGDVPAPYVRAYIDIRRLGITEPILFPMDTGSYSTCIHPSDATRLGIDYREFAGRPWSSSTGIGGGIGYNSEPAWLLFVEPDGTRRFCEMNIHICETATATEMQNLPSLLGRDFLNLCALTVDYFNDVARLEPHNVVDGFVMPPTSP